MREQSQHKWAILASMSAMLFLVNLDSTATNLALAQIGHALHATLNTIKLIASAATIMAASTMIVTGRLAEVFGRKKVFMIGLLFFISGSLLAGVAQQAWQLILGRALVGLGFATVMPVASSTVYTTFSGQQRSIVIGIYLSLAGFGQSLGPLLGSFLLSWFGWRSIFLVNVPFCIVIGLLVHNVVVETQSSHERVSYHEIALLSTGIITTMFALNMMSHSNMAFWQHIIISMFGLSCLLLFIRMVSLDRSFLISKKIFYKREFLLAILLRITMQYGLFTFLFLAGLLLQNYFGYTVTEAGILLLANTIATGLMAIFAGRLIDKFNVKIPAVASMMLMMAGFFLLLWINSSSSVELIIAAFVLVGAGAGIAVVCSSLLGVSTAAEGKATSTMATLFALSMLGGALGVTISGLLIQLAAYHGLQPLIAHSGLSEHLIALIEKTVTGVYPLPLLAKQLASVQPELIPAITSLFKHSFAWPIGICCALTINTMILLWRYLSD